MSNPIGRLDITHFKGTDIEVKIGEVTLNEDNSLEGFLFENNVIRRLVAMDPSSLSLGLVVHPDRPASPVEEIGNGG